jgi:glycosyltransferase involved in cell wall biosynthesis
MRERLRITHVVLSLDVGGLERNVVNQIRAGHELGQDVSVICLEKRGVLAPRAETLGAPVLCLEKRPGIHLGVIARLRRAVANLRPHVVHTHQIGPLFYAGPALLGLGVPLVVHTEHGKVDYHGSLRKRWLGRLAGLHTDRFYCLSRDMADAVAAQGVVPRGKLSVIDNGIALEDYQSPCDTQALRQSLGIPKLAPVIGNVARLHEIKRHDVLIRAVKRVRDAGVDAHLLLVGDGPLRSELAALATELGLTDIVHFAGFQPQTTAYVQMMDCFALTSRSEGMPQALLEACAAGTPVIASQVGGIPEVIEHEHSGLLVPVGDEASLAAGIFRLLGNRAWALQLAEQARQGVLARFDIRRMAQDYHRDYLRLLRCA